MNIEQQKESSIDDVIATAKSMNKAEVMAKYEQKENSIHSFYLYPNPITPNGILKLGLWKPKEPKEVPPSNDSEQSPSDEEIPQIEDWVTQRQWEQAFDGQKETPSNLRITGVQIFSMTGALVQEEDKQLDIEQAKYGIIKLNNPANWAYIARIITSDNQITSLKFIVKTEWIQDYTDRDNFKEFWPSDPGSNPVVIEYNP